MTHQCKFQTFLQSSKMVFVTFWVWYIQHTNCGYSPFIQGCLWQLKWHHNKGNFRFLLFISATEKCVRARCLVKLKKKHTRNFNHQLKIIALLKFRFPLFPRIAFEKPITTKCVINDKLLIVTRTTPSHWKKHSRHTWGIFREVSWHSFKRQFQYLHGN